jgi:hypothetical protein
MVCMFPYKCGITYSTQACNKASILNISNGNMTSSHSHLSLWSSRAGHALVHPSISKPAANICTTHSTVHRVITTGHSL